MKTVFTMSPDKPGPDRLLTERRCPASDLTIEVLSNSPSSCLQEASARLRKRGEGYVYSQWRTSWCW